MHNIAIATFNSPEYQALANLTLPSKRAYCKLHNYTLVDQWPDIDGWERFNMVRQLLPKFDAVLWTGADVIILEPKPCIGALIDDRDGECLCVVAKDDNGINSDVILFINRPLTFQLFDQIFAQKQTLKDDNFQEQRALSNCQENVMWNKRIRIVPKRMINSYIDDVEDGDWMVQFPGLPMHIRLKHAQLYADRSDRNFKLAAGVLSCL